MWCRYSSARRTPYSRYAIRDSLIPSGKYDLSRESAEPEWDTCREIMREGWGEKKKVRDRLSVDSYRNPWEETEPRADSRSWTPVWTWAGSGDGTVGTAEPHSAINMHKLWMHKHIGFSEKKLCVCVSKIWKCPLNNSQSSSTNARTIIITGPKENLSCSRVIANTNAVIFLNNDVSLFLKQIMVWLQNP